MKIIEHFVGGKSFSGDSKKTGKVFNPATGEQSSEVKLASSKDVNQAVEIAKKAFEHPVCLKVIFATALQIAVTHPSQRLKLC